MKMELPPSPKQGDNLPAMNVTPLTVVVTLKAKPGQESTLRSELLALIPTTRQEPGCLNYDLHQAVDNPALLVFHETWASRKLLDEHIARPHVQAFFAKTGDLLVEPPQIIFCEKIG
jgi:quinol monooxygenase YgiN